MQKLRIVPFRVGDRSRGRFATPADSPHQDCSAYRGIHARRESLGFVHRSRAIFCRPAPNPNRPIRNFFTAVTHRLGLVVVAIEQRDDAGEGRVLRGGRPGGQSLPRAHLMIVSSRVGPVPGWYKQIAELIDPRSLNA